MYQEQNPNKQIDQFEISIYRVLFIIRNKYNIAVYSCSGQ